MPFTIELDGLQALVTGAGQGVGRAIGLALAQAGATVLVNDIDHARASAVVGEIQVQGGAAEACVFDVTDYDGVLASIAGRRVDVLVNNAGNAGVDGFNFAPFAESSPADWERYLQVNLYGVLHCTRAVLPGMIARERGRVITIISDAGRWGEPSMSAYSAAKAGAAGFTRAVAREVGRSGITVNNVALGTIEPSLPEDGGVGAVSTRAGAAPGDLGLSAVLSPVPDPSELTDEARARRQRQVARYIVRRLGQPDDVAGLVTFLASPLASWITGQTYPVNGGYTVNQ
jgi:NAD(P)-dependent dehydrogenase (short-subunit alcohol dehydrogenase family)